MADDKIVTKRGIYLYINGQQINNDLKSVQGEFKKLQNEQAKMTIGSEKYIQTGKKIQALDSIIQEHRKQWRKTTTEVDKAKKSLLSFDKINDIFSKYSGIVLSMIASLTGLSFALNQLKKQRDEFEQKGANLQALTGLSDDAVTWFKDKAKLLSTSITSAGVRIRKEATDILNAFMLVGSAKPELLENKEALAEVTEEILILSEAADDMNLKDVVDSSTLAMNQFGTEAKRTTNVLAAGSKAGSANVNSVAKALRNSGVAANSANVTLEQTVGLIETLAEKGIKDEMAGTGLKTFLLKLQQGADKFNPKIVGLTAALQNLKKENMDASKMIAVFGLEAYTVAQTLIEGTNRVDHFTKAVTDTSIATEQAVTNTKTSGAVLKQTMNALKLEAMEMVDKIGPVFTISANGVRYLVKIIPPLIQFTKEHGRTIVELTAIVISYSAALKAKATILTILNGYNKTRQAFALLQAASLANQAGLQGRYNAAMKVYNGLVLQGNIGVKAATAVTLLWSAAKAALSGNIAKATIAMKALNRMIGISPMGALAIIITGVTVALLRWAEKTREATREVKLMAEINQEAVKSLSNEKAELESLLSVAKNENISKETRIKAIKLLNEISPEYLGNLNLENINTSAADTAVKKYTESLMKNAKAKAIQNKLSQLYDEQLQYETKLYDLQKRREELKENKLGFSDEQLYYANLEISLKAKDINEDKSKIDAQIDKLIDLYNQNADQYQISIPVSIQTENKQALLEQLDRERDELLAKIETDKKKPLSIVSPVDLAKLEYYNKRIEDTIDAIEALTREKTKVYPTPVPVGTGGNEAERKKALEKATDELEKAYHKQTNIIKQAYIEQKRTSDQMQSDLYTEEMRYLYAKIDLLKRFGQDTTDIEMSLWDKIITAAQKASKEVKGLKFTPEEEKEDENPFWAELAKGTEIQIALNEAKYKAGLISHQEYLYNKGILDEKYRKEKEAKDKVAAEHEMEIRESVLNAISSLANSAVTIMQSAQSREEAAIEKKYKYKLILAEGDNEATAELEEQKEAELLAIKKKYADKQFALQVLQITADTAVAAMRAYNAALELGLFGIPLAPVMAAAAVAAGFAQIAAANQAREQAANMWDGGYTGEGGKYEKKKLIQTHGGEFVANKKTVQILRPVFDIMDYAQRTGNVAALTGPDMARALGSSSTPSSGTPNNMPVSIGQTASTNPDIIRALDNNTRMIALIRKKLEEPFIGEVYVDGPRGVKQNLTDYDKLIKNATR
ncbi:phage tail tape measure protein [Parabacteroides provencensis]|uniref:phage tail tape measure protein n=1 Tax=Parabacteroides provencensis TaxID=1944636 RepID=UPI000C159193|nr:phage tail tape measure protein [Parabacteroides provencensis]